MSTNHHALGMEALLSAALHFEEAQRALDTESLVASAAQSAASKLVADLVRATRRPPTWHLGHLDEATFEQVRELLEVAPADVKFRELGASGSIFLIEVTVAGLRIEAQRSAPSVIVASSKVYTAPEPKLRMGDEAAQ